MLKKATMLVSDGRNGGRKMSGSLCSYWPEKFSILTIFNIRGEVTFPNLLALISRSWSANFGADLPNPFYYLPFMPWQSIIDFWWKATLNLSERPHRILSSCCALKICRVFLLTGVARSWTDPSFRSRSCWGNSKSLGLQVVELMNS